MKNYIRKNDKLMKKQDFRDELLISGRICGGRNFDYLKIGQYELSIQASDCHYCEPRKTLDDIKLYKSWEIALFKNGEWLNIELDEDKELFSKWKYYDEFLHRYDGMVAGYVSTEIIQDLCNFLKVLESESVNIEI